MIIGRRERDTRAWFWRDEEGTRNPFGPRGATVFTEASTRAKCFLVMKGQGEFPLDMLRYDQAFCLTPIPHPDHSFERQYHVVVGFSDRQPSARWITMGWYIVGPVPAEQAEVLRVDLLSQKGFCHRCGQQPSIGELCLIMSWFDPRSFICPDCGEEERAHPDFELARSTLRQAYATKNFDFPGVGYPGQGRLP